MTRTPARRILEVLQIDAFTTVPFAGNPAGVVLEADGLDEAEMQQIATEMNVSETAFVAAPTAVGTTHRLRWFTPACEVGFCGHATVATVHALLERGRVRHDRIVFDTIEGPLPVSIARDGEGVTIWLEPALPTLTPFAGPLREVLDALGLEAAADWALAVVTSECDLLVPAPGLRALHALVPDLRRLAALARDARLRGICVVACEGVEPGSLTHARFFAPHYGVAEDPVTGSVHAAVPVWLWEAGRLRAGGGVARFTAEQGDVLGRPGRVSVELHVVGDGPARVRVGGRAVTVLEGTMRLRASPGA
jgi:PhzF family phenazine biosynthesis protein